jgi:hypothetical protein
VPILASMLGVAVAGVGRDSRGSNGVEPSPIDEVDS